jgi:hypothetical protein
MLRRYHVTRYFSLYNDGTTRAKHPRLACCVELQQVLLMLVALRNVRGNQIYAAGQLRTTAFSHSNVPPTLREVSQAPLTWHLPLTRSIYRAVRPYQITVHSRSSQRDTAANAAGRWTPKGTRYLPGCLPPGPAYRPEGPMIHRSCTNQRWVVRTASCSIFITCVPARFLLLLSYLGHDTCCATGTSTDTHAGHTKRNLQHAVDRRCTCIIQCAVAYKRSISCRDTHCHEVGGDQRPYYGR